MNATIIVKCRFSLIFICWNVTFAIQNRFVMQVGYMCVCIIIIIVEWISDDIHIRSISSMNIFGMLWEKWYSNVTVTWFKLYDSSHRHHMNYISFHFFYAPHAHFLSNYLFVINFLLPIILFGLHICWTFSPRRAH